VLLTVHEAIEANASGGRHTIHRSPNEGLKTGAAGDLAVPRGHPEHLCIANSYFINEIRRSGKIAVRFWFGNSVQGTASDSPTSANHATDLNR